MAGSIEHVLQLALFAETAQVGVCLDLFLSVCLLLFCIEEFLKVLGGPVKATVRNGTILSETGSTFGSWKPNFVVNKAFGNRQPIVASDPKVYIRYVHRPARPLVLNFTAPLLGQIIPWPSHLGAGLWAATTIPRAQPPTHQRYYMLKIPAVRTTAPSLLRSPVANLRSPDLPTRVRRTT